MHFAQNPRLFMEDEPFLVAIYEAGRHWENRNLLAKEKATIEWGSGMGNQLNTGSKGTTKAPREKGKGKEEPQHNEGQIAKTERGKL